MSLVRFPFEAPSKSRYINRYSGFYAKGTENEDSDIAIISDDFEDIYECMGMTWNIDARIELHQIKKKDFEEESDCFIKEVINTGVKVA